MHNYLPITLLCVLVSACASLPGDLEKPHISLQAVGLKAISLLQQRFNLYLSLQNPNNRNLALQGLDLAVELNGQPFATVVSHQALILPRLDSASMTVEATTQLSSWLNQMRLLRHKDARQARQFHYRLTGNVYAGTFGIRMPVEEQGEVNLDDFLGDPPDSPPLPTPSQPALPARPATLPDAI